MYHSYQETATLIALLLKRFAKTRARVSRRIVKRIARREQLRVRFLTMLEVSLEDFGWKMFELESGGFGFVAIRAIEGAERVSAKNLFSFEERDAIDDKEVDWVAVETELYGEDSEE